MEHEHNGHGSDLIIPCRRISPATYDFSLPSDVITQRRLNPATNNLTVTDRELGLSPRLADPRQLYTFLVGSSDAAQDAGIAHLICIIQDDKKFQPLYVGAFEFRTTDARASPVEPRAPLFVPSYSSPGADTADDVTQRYRAARDKTRHSVRA